MLASGARVRQFAEIDSTSAEARRLAREGERGPVWIVAARQTAGRGRRGSPWASPTGGLYATWLGAGQADALRAGWVPFIAGLALWETLAGLAPPDAARADAARADAARDLRLKWPNDVLWCSAKVAGLLVETGGVPGGWLAAGFGVNLRRAPAVEGRATAALADFAATEIAPAKVLAALDAAFAQWRERLARPDGPVQAREAWLARAWRLGEEIEARLDDGTLVRGVMAGVARDGALRLAGEGGEQLIRAGEVSV